MSLRLRRFCGHLVAALAAASAASCTSKTSTVGQLTSSSPVANPASTSTVDPIDASERIVTDAIAQVRESAVALEYTAADAPTGTRRAASGVVVGYDGELLSVRIDPPSAAAPIVAKVASGRRLPAQWVASDPETGLTLLKIEPGTARPAAPSSKGRGSACRSW